RRAAASPIASRRLIVLAFRSCMASVRARRYPPLRSLNHHFSGPDDAVAGPGCFSSTVKTPRLRNLRGLVGARDRMSSTSLAHGFPLTGNSGRDDKRAACNGLEINAGVLR